MVRKLILALAVLGIVALPALPAQAAEHERREHEGRFERHERFERSEPRFSFGIYGPGFGVYGPGFYEPAPSCAYEPGHWVNQPYVDAYGNYTYVQQWVPGHSVCS
jgi:hypothetical protein